MEATENAQAYEMETEVLKLKRPLVSKEKTWTELTIKEPSAAELELAEVAGRNGDTARTIKLLSLVCGIHETFIKNLLGSDLARAAKIMNRFLDTGPTTGGTE